jgi:hypothetical protein
LLQLPPELRNRIWELVLCGKVLKCVQLAHTDEKERMAPPLSDPVCGLDLLRTCRQIYSETVLLPYSRNIYLIPYLRWAKSDVRYLKPFQRAQITHIRLDTITLTVLKFKSPIHQKRAKFDYLPALKRIHVLHFRQGMETESWFENCTKEVTEQLKVLCSGRNISFTFEVTDQGISEYNKQ